MMSDQDKGQPTPKQAGTRTPNRHGSAPEPEWAGGLRKLYDSVVEEPIPDCFMDLLSKLDDSK